MRTSTWHPVDTTQIVAQAPDPSCLSSGLLPGGKRPKPGDSLLKSFRWLPCTFRIKCPLIAPRPGTDCLLPLSLTSPHVTPPLMCPPHSSVSPANAPSPFQPRGLRVCHSLRLESFSLCSLPEYILLPFLPQLKRRFLNKALSALLT